MFNAIRFTTKTRSGSRHILTCRRWFHIESTAQIQSFSVCWFSSWHKIGQSSFAWGGSHGSNRSIINSCERVTRAPAHTDNLMHEARHISVGGTFEGNFSNGRNCGLTFYVNELSEAASPGHSHAAHQPKNVATRSQWKFHLLADNVAWFNPLKSVHLSSLHRCHPFWLCLPRSQCLRQHKKWTLVKWN